jgi:uncharacterized phosphatase
MVEHQTPLIDHRRATSERSRQTLVYLARHGRTELNLLGVLRGRLDPSLDSVGRHEGLSLGDALSQVPLARVVSSPLRRAVETARYVAVRAKLEVQLEERFIDRDYGTSAGSPPDVVKKLWGSIDEAPGVEPWESIVDRAMNGLDDVERCVRGRAACVISHDAVIRALLTTIGPELGRPETINLETGNVSVIEHDGRNWNIAGVNCVSNSVTNGDVARLGSLENDPSMEEGRFSADG